MNSINLGIRERKEYIQFIQSTLHEENQEISFPQDPFLYISSNEEERKNFNYLLENSNWDPIIQNLFWGISWPFEIADLDMANITEESQEEKNEKELIHRKIELFTVGEFIFNFIHQYMDPWSAISFALTCRFSYFIIVANLHANYINIFCQFPSSSNSNIRDLNHILNSLSLDQSFTQLHDAYTLFIRNELLIGIQNVMGLLKTKYMYICKESKETEDCKQFILNFISKNIKNGASEISPIIAICQRNSIDVLEYLMELNICINMMDTNSDNLNCIQLAIRNKNPQMIIRLFNYMGKGYMERYILSQNVRLGFFAQTVYPDHVQTLRTLFQLINSSSLKTGELNEVVYLAVKMRANNIFHIFLEHLHSFDINHLNKLDDKTMLMLSIKTNNQSIFKLIMQQSNIDINISNSKGKSALFYAVQMENIQFVRLLDEEGGNWDQISKNEDTILHMALKSKKMEIIHNAFLSSSFATFNKINLDGVSIKQLVNRHIEKYLTNYYEECLKETEILNIYETALRVQKEQKYPIPLELIQLNLKLNSVQKKGKDYNGNEYNFKLLKNRNKIKKRRNSASILGESGKLIVDSLPGEVKHPIYRKADSFSNFYTSKRASGISYFLSANEVAKMFSKERIGRICFFLLLFHHNEWMKRNSKEKDSELMRKFSRQLSKKVTRTYIFEPKPIATSTPISSKHKILDNADIRIPSQKRVEFWYRNERQQLKCNINIKNKLISSMSYLYKLKRELHQKSYTGIRNKSRFLSLIPKVEYYQNLFKRLYMVYLSDKEAICNVIFPIAEQNLFKLDNEEFINKENLQVYFKDQNNPLILKDKTEKTKKEEENINRAIKGNDVKPIDNLVYERLLGNFFNSSSPARETLISYSKLKLSKIYRTKQLSRNTSQANERELIIKGESSCFKLDNFHLNRKFSTNSIQRADSLEPQLTVDPYKDVETDKIQENKEEYDEQEEEGEISKYYTHIYHNIDPTDVEYSQLDIDSSLFERTKPYSPYSADEECTSNSIIHSQSKTIPKLKRNSKIIRGRGIENIKILPCLSRAPSGEQRKKHKFISREERDNSRCNSLGNENNKVNKSTQVSPIYVFKLNGGKVGSIPNLGNIKYGNGSKNSLPSNQKRCPLPVGRAFKKLRKYQSILPNKGQEKYKFRTLLQKYEEIISTGTRNRWNLRAQQRTYMNSVQAKKNPNIRFLTPDIYKLDSLKPKVKTRMTSIPTISFLENKNKGDNGKKGSQLQGKLKLTEMKFEFGLLCSTSPDNKHLATNTVDTSHDHCLKQKKISNTSSKKNNLSNTLKIGDVSKNKGRNNQLLIQGINSLY